MAADLATLELRVNRTEVEQGTKALNDLSASSEKAAKSSSAMTDSQRFMASVLKAANGDYAKAATALRNIGSTSEAAAMEAMALGSATKDVTRSMGLAEIQAYKMAAAMEAGTTSTGMHGLQLGRLNMELGTFIGRLTGANTAVTRLAAMVGGNIVGYGQMIGALVAISGLLWVWEKMTEGAKQTADAIKAVKDEIKKAQEATGALADEAVRANTAQAEIALANAQRDAARGGPTSKGEDAAGLGPGGLSIREARKALDEAHTLELQRLIDRTSTDAKIRREAEQTYAANLELLVSHNQATTAERQRALDLYRKNGEEIAALAKTQTDNERRTFLIEQNDALKKALFPVDKQALKDLAEEYQRTTEIINDRNREAKSLRDRLESEALQEFERNQEEERKSVADNVNEQLKIRKRLYDEQEAEAVAQLHRNQQYSDEIERIWSHGFANIVTRGLNSWSGFFDSVFQLSTRLFEKLKVEDGKFIAGLAASALGGSIAGFQMGQSGGALQGAFGGALSGGAMGFQYGGGPGAVIGALGGAAGGLLGAAFAQKEAARQQEAAANAMRLAAAAANYQTRDAFTAFLNASNGDEAAARIKSVGDQAIALWGRMFAAVDDHGNKLFNADDFAQLDAATKKQIKAIEDEIAAREKATALLNSRAFEDLSVRLLRANGDGSAADDAAFRNAQHREFQDAQTAGKSKEFLDLLTSVQVQEAIQRAQTIEIEKQTKAIQDGLAAQVAAYDAQIKTAQAALQVAQESLRKQEQQVAATQRAFDAITQFASGLSLNTSLSTLSPIQQRAEAQRQYEAQLALALGGDRNAATGLSGIAQTFLTSSRSVNASGSNYVADFLKVQRDLGGLKDIYGTALSVEQQTLRALQDAVLAAQRQIDIAQTAKEQAQADAQRMLDALMRGNVSLNDITAIQRQWQNEGGGFGGGRSSEDIQILEGTNTRLDSTNTYLSAVQENTFATVNAVQGVGSVFTSGVGVLASRLDRIEAAVAAINVRGAGA